MLQLTEQKNAIESGAYDGVLCRLYGESMLCAARSRYIGLLDAFQKEFGIPHAGAALFSAPGRSELIGNHTDHQHGVVLAAAVSLDFAAVAAKRRQSTATIASSGYRRFQIGLDSIAPHEAERNSTKAFVRGVAAYLKQHGYCVGGFDAVMQSDVPRGSGLSSSAAYGVLIGSIWNGLYNDGRIPFTEIALAAQYAENVYFGKPSGLMDQLASAAGGFAAIDFLNPAAPEIVRIDCDFDKMGYAICIINAGGNHAGLTNEYADIPNEMHLVAAQFGKAVLREVDRSEFDKALPMLRNNGVPDRALLRSMHFFDENERAIAAKDALSAHDMVRFLALSNASGRSSALWLQNVCPKNKNERSISLALALAEQALAGQGAFRVHGGGFAGTVQAIVPVAEVEEFTKKMERTFGRGNCYLLRVRPLGGIMLQRD